MSRAAPAFWLIAGPNGVGKTTYAFRSLEALTGSVNFINMAEIARGLSPLDPAAAEGDAARLALSRARELIAAGRTFAMETTMSGRVHLRLFEMARAVSMRTHLMYFSAASPEICLQRIARRVAEGGHDVPEPVVRRRFVRSHSNLPRYTAASDLWRLYETSGPRPCLALEGSGRVVAHRDETCLARANPALQGFARELGSV
ncbi:MAG: AAA family ATPase [Roseitalea porphyridii]|jgi:predicted ABC-type ATPase|uniref:AAA family ATPase n=1 Tax=Roseitalea porphyridii TaxID=1852022 RepID=UPI0032EDF99A